MKPPNLDEDERDEQSVLQLLELLQRFGDPLKRPAKVIPWPTSPKKAPIRRLGPSTEGNDAASYTPGSRTVDRTKK